MRSINFISTVLTNTSYHYDELLPFLTVTSVMMFIFDNSITFADKFHLLSIDQYGILKSIQFDDIKRMSNSIYTLAHEKDYYSISKLNPLYNSPRDYYSLGNSIDFYTQYGDELFNKHYDKVPVLDLELNNVKRIPFLNGFDLCKVVFNNELLYALTNADQIINFLNKTISRGLTHHPLFLYDNHNGTYDICVCTHNIPTNMNISEFTKFGIDKYSMQDRYLLNIIYNIPAYFLKTIILLADNAEIIDHTSEIVKCYYKIKKTNIELTPTQFYLHNNMLIQKEDVSFLITNNNISKDVLSIYDQIYSDIGFKQHKVCTNDTIIKIHKDWIK